MDLSLAAKVSCGCNVLLLGVALYFLIYTGVTSLTCKADLEDVNDGSNKCLRAAAAKAAANAEDNPNIDVEEQCKEFVDEELAAGDGTCTSEDCKALYEGGEVKKYCVDAAGDLYSDTACKKALTDAIQTCHQDKETKYAQMITYAQVLIGAYALVLCAESTNIMMMESPKKKSDESQQKDGDNEKN